MKRSQSCQRCQDLQPWCKALLAMVNSQNNQKIQHFALNPLTLIL